MIFYQLSNGNVAGFDDVAEAPDGAVEITAEEFAALVFSPPLSLAEAQATQKVVIDEAYAASVQADISFKTAAGVTETFEADSTSQTYLMQTTQGYAIAGAVPTGFYWVAAANTQVAFTLADLQGLYQAILAQGWAAFQKRQTLKASIDAASTVAAVQAIVWA